MTELFAWETDPGYAIHILNYTNPNMLRGWFRRTYPIGRQQVRWRLPKGEKVARVRALRTGVGTWHSVRTARCSSSRRQRCATTRVYRAAAGF